ncbi:MAG: hypothetical protein PHP44_14765, partial [Kiritimatiellae bacterium]|nr:hypothetical protein [Kiritimatiellia bacterium]
QEIDTLRHHYAYTTTNLPGILLLCPENPANLTTSSGQSETWPNPASMPPTRNAFRLEADTALFIPFDAGPVPTDHSRYAHSITDQGTWLASGKHQLNGSGEYLAISDHPAMDNTPAITLALELNPAALPASTTALLSKSDSYTLALESDGHLTFCIASTDTPVRSLSLLATGQLHQVVAVFDGTLPAEQRIRIYLNRQLDQTGASTHAVIPRTPTSVLCIGAETPAAPVTLNATLGPIRLIRKPLAPAQILNLSL